VKGNAVEIMKEWRNKSP